MTYIYVIYRESTSENMCAFTTRELAEAFIAAYEAREGESEDFYIDMLDLRNEL